ncbi:Rab-GTPase-TBC domain-containing protein [Giardia muris]|uniref:Rab-GTPase-TBC domain-containing protein n=1 Tax=Giardia muris TaxID=5742 RepID=A0A4Z1SP73_GIAMU|nr:Rab-GTPase-TBC domain-containing protein [Giardia muris]|eukprot:TNJ27606.1 Rab-GTPase-TBC domain-containing protein [Giardia muris]
MDLCEWLGLGEAGRTLGAVRARLQRRVVREAFPEGVRVAAWLVLAGAEEADADGYRRLLGQGPASSAAKIARDAPRTFRGATDFGARVEPGAITRVLNAAMHDLGAHYVQGMNALCGVLVYVGGELLGFALFRRLCRLLPTYFGEGAREGDGLVGCAAGCALVERVLEAADCELLHHLRRHGMAGPLLGYGTLLSLGAALEPLREVVVLWDFLLAFTPAVMPLVVSARLILARPLLLRSQNPLGVSQGLPLDARACIAKALELYAGLSPDAVDLVARHVCDPDACRRLLGAKERGEGEESENLDFTASSASAEA